jgi:UDP-2,3-diacylglucosamine pyrophosphatase LpxH
VRIAVISDTHFGDEHCTLVSVDHQGVPEIGPAYRSLEKAVGRADYLILLGDIFDFSVTSYENAYKQAKVFFKKVQEDSLAEQLIYVPGNHDYDTWHTVEHQVNVINQLKQGQLPRAFRRSVPGVIDDRMQSEEKFRLPDITAKPEIHEDHASYGNLFLDNITRSGRWEGPKLTFNFAYPNLYLITDEGECVLLTHGHYFEAYWSIASEWVSRIAGDDLPLDLNGELNLREMVGINLPLSQLACTGVGQAQPLTEILRGIQTEIQKGETTSLDKYLARLHAELRREKKLPFALRFAESLLFRWVRKQLLGFLGGMEKTRYSKEFINRPSVRERFRNYFHASLNEIQRLQEEHGLDIPVPNHVIFGHTHQPIPWGSEELIDKVNGHDVRLCNTGGWLIKEDGGGEFTGAEVVVYETGRGLRSEPIRAKDLENVDYPSRASSASPMSSDTHRIQHEQSQLVTWQP